VVWRIAAAAAVVMVLVVLVATFASRRLAEREAVNDAARTTDLFAESVLQPALRDGITSGQPEAVARLRDVSASGMQASRIVRIKLWTPDGRVVFSDEPLLVGQKFPLGDEQRSVLARPQTRAEISALHRPENRLERGQGKLLEVYRPVWTPNGQPLLFETYSRYTDVVERSGQIWRGLAGVTLTSVLLLTVLFASLAMRLIDGLRRGHAQREALLHRAMDASAQERRRVAAFLHDGPVQDLAASSFSLDQAAASARREGEMKLASALSSAALLTRANIRSLRSLLVDIYPPGLRSSGLVTALNDMAGSVQGHGLAVTLVAPDAVTPRFAAATEQLVFRVAQECLRNAAKHARATRAEMRLSVEAKVVRFEVADDGTGFDPDVVLANPEHGHFGLRMMIDLAQQENAVLEVASRPGCGTRWRLLAPLHPVGPPGRHLIA
jgi:signal transduction histidine kinase